MKEWGFRYIDISSFFIKHNILSINGLSLTPSMCWSIIKKKENDEMKKAQRKSKVSTPPTNPRFKR